jgi:hypothetical protein
MTFHLTTKIVPVFLCAVAFGAAVPAQFAPATAQTASSPGPPKPCSGHSSQRVTIESCSFTLGSSPAGNPNYFVTVTLRYAAPSPAMAIRFRCALGDGGSTVSRYGVLRQSGANLTFVSPFVTSVVKSVDCFVDAT